MRDCAIQCVYNVHVYVSVICSLSSQMESQIGNSATLETAMSTYFELSDVCLSLEKSFCTNLKHFALSLENHWGGRLRETLSKYVCLYYFCNFIALGC